MPPEPMQRPPGLRRRRWRRRVVLLAASLIASVLLLEAAMWLGDALPPRPRAYVGENENRTHPNFETDAELGWRTRKNLDCVIDGEGGAIPVFADAEGHRIASPDRAAAAGSRTIVLAGDSFVWGAGVAYEATLAGLLAQRIGDVRIENLAQPGYGIDQVVLAVERHGFAPKPDLIVVGLYPMDFGRSLTAYRGDLGFNKPTFVLDGGELRRMTVDDRPGTVWRWLEDHSRLLGVWRRAERTLGFRIGVGNWWRVNEALLDRLCATARQHDVPVLLLHVPMPDWRDFPPLASYCERRGLPLIDPVALEPQRPAGMYFPPAGHWTPAGHARVAAWVLEWIAQHGPERLR